MYLQLENGETTSSSDPAIVLDSWGSDNRTKLVDGTRSNGGSFGETSLSTTMFAAGLYQRNQSSSSTQVKILRSDVSPFRFHPDFILEGDRIRT